MSALAPFTYSGQQVRTVVIDGEPWFVAADVARILGYSATEAMTRTLDDEEKGMQIVQTLGGEQSMTVVNESGIYSAVLRSRIPEAKAFKRWVTSEVLPSIRKTGSYGAPAALDASTPEGAALVLQAALTFQAQVAELTPKAAAYDKFLDSTSLIKIEVAARQAGVGRVTAFKLLRQAGIIQKWSKAPMQPHAHRFKEVPSTHENSAGELVTDYTTKVRPEHFDWLVSTLERLSGKQEMEALA